MPLNDKRTQYPNFENRVFHIYPDPSAGAPTGLKAKYGDNVIRWGAGVGAATAINSANPGDTILFWPGTYVITTTINVNRPNITIRSATGNPSSVVFNASAAGGADIITFTITAAAANTILRDVTIIGDDSASPVDAVQVSGAGTHVDNCRFPSATAVDSAANPAISLEDDADDCVISNNWIKDHQVGIQVNAAERAMIVNNTIISSDDAALGIDLLGVCSFSEARSNKLWLRGGTGDVGIQVNAVALDCFVTGNFFHSDMNVQISPGTQAGNADTIMTQNHEAGQDTADGSLILA